MALPAEYIAQQLPRTKANSNRHMQQNGVINHGKDQENRSQRATNKIRILPAVTISVLTKQTEISFAPRTTDPYAVQSYVVIH
jgi:hypothetical protein